MTQSHCLCVIFLCLVVGLECKSQIYYESEIGESLQAGQFRSADAVAVDANGNIYVVDAVSHTINKFDASGTPLLQWGGYGSEDGQFRNPKGVAVDANGHIYVADADNFRIQKFSSIGTFIAKWGSQGSSEGQFTGPSDIAIDASGNIYVTDPSSNRIQKFSSTGTYITSRGGTGSDDGRFDYPRAIAVDATGNVYVADSYNHRIQKFSSNLIFITKWGTEGTANGELYYPMDIAVDANGNVYVTENARVQKFSSTGSFITKWGSQGSSNGQFYSPKGVAVDGNGNVYIAEDQNIRVQKFSSDGTFISKWESQSLNNKQFDRPQRMAVDASGNIYVSDTYNHRILKFSSAGVFITSWGTRGSGNGQFRSPHGIAVDLNGNVYVADPGNARIQKFSSNGAFLTAWNSASPNGIAVNANGEVYVTELSGGGRVRKFSSTGAAITSWGSSGSEQFSGPYGIAVDATGMVYVAYLGNHKIRKFNSNGVYLTSFDQPYFPSDVAVDTNGNLYVVDTKHRILKFSPHGAVITTFGSQGAQEGEFNNPNGIAIDASGYIYVADSDNHRIQQFSTLAVSSFSPDKGTPGATITISGTGFSTDAAQNTVRFNGITATVTASSTKSITATIPSGATTGKISVTRDGKTIESPNEFLVLPLAINSFSPTIGGTGVSVTITGSGFSTTPGNNEVKFNGVTATLVENSSTRLKAIVPTGVTDGKITVTTLGQTATSSSNFKVTPIVIINANFPGYYTIDETTATATITVNDATHIQAAQFMSKGIAAMDNPYKVDVVSKPPSGNTLTFAISASYFSDPIGIRGYFSLTDSNGNEVTSELHHIYIRYPSTATTHAIPNLIFGNQQKDYQLISIPLDLADKKVNSVFKALGNYDITKYRLYSSTGSSNFELSGNSSLTVGRGYWLIAKNKTEIIPGEGTTVRATEENPFVIELNPGANLIGNPYNFNVQWSDVLEYNNNPENVGNLIHFKNGTVGTTPVLERYRGAFVRVTGNDPVSLKIPVRKNNTVNGGRMKTTPPSPLDAPSWSLPLTVDDGIIRNELIGIGMHPEANESVDRWDILDIPIPIDAFTISMRETPEGTVINDVVTTSPHYTWHGQLDSHNGVTLSWDNSFFGDNDKHLVLEIEGQAQLINMRSFTQTFVPRGSQTFFIHYGNEEYIKSETLTEQVLTSHVYPNPFNKNSESIQIAMALPKGTTTVHLSLIDTKGKTAALSPEAQFDEGRRLITWKNDYSLLSSGLYLLRIAVTDKSGPQYFYKKLLIE